MSSRRISEISRGRAGNFILSHDAGTRPGRHDDDAIRQRDGLFQIVGHEHDRLLVLRPQVEQKVAHDDTRLRIERAEGLVHQQIFRIADQHLRKADALALSPDSICG